MEPATQTLADQRQAMAIPLAKPASEADRAGKYLIFQLGGEEFGTAVLKVREIIGMQEITSVPQTPVYMKGVMNLRGKVVPVVDLRLKFGMESAAYTDRTCIVVVRSLADTRELLVGVIVDSVSEVLSLGSSDIEDTPQFGCDAPGEYLIGMAKVKGQVKILLEIDQVLNRHELNALHQVLA